MMKETRLVRTVNGTQYNYKATRIQAVDSDHTAKETFIWTGAERVRV